MTSTVALASFLVSFVYIFLKATQQLNVVSQRYWLVVPTSIGLGLCEATILLYVVRADTVWIGALNGVGAALGAMLAMLAHKHVRKWPSILTK